ncbi:hypothetical protein [Asticcacaulis solisilvae]|uniref:hypothetical protein n=1 Tax=Asticcacaulis solisilvae TaxID=1217274 RepID=UPI003FD70DB8
MKKMFAILAACGALIAMPAAADSPADVLSLITDANALMKRGVESLDEAETHWRLGNTSQTCDSLEQAHSAFTRAYGEEQQVKSDLESGDVLSGEDARSVREWVDEFESYIPQISDKMKRFGANC